MSHLAAFGAVNIAWNDIEASVNAALGMALGLPQLMWIEVSSRINGLDGKLPIIKQAINIQHQLDPAACQAIADTFGQIERHKKFRDGIIHAKIFDPADPIAPTAQRKGIEDEVIVSESALYQLYDILIGIREEMDDILFMLMAMNSMSDPISDAKEKLSAAQSIQACIPLLHHHQQITLALPLSQFPKEPPSRLEKEAPQSRRT